MLGKFFTAKNSKLQRASKNDIIGKEVGSTLKIIQGGKSYPVDFSSKKWYNEWKARRLKRLNNKGEYSVR